MIFAFNGRKDTAGLCEISKRFAVFFLLLLIFNSSLFAFPFSKVETNSSRDAKPVFVYENKLQTIESEGDSVTVKPVKYTSFPFKPRNISGNLKNLCAWDSASQKLFFCDKEGNLKASVKLEAGLVRTNGKFLFAQDKIFEDGFDFSFYEIKRSFLGRKKLEKLFSVKLDCFVSDTVFCGRGIWFCGGNKNDDENTVYFADYVLQKVQKVFTTAKNNDFLRLIKCEGEQEAVYGNGTENNSSVEKTVSGAKTVSGTADNSVSVYAFLSGRLKQHGSLNIYRISYDFAFGSAYDGSQNAKVSSINLTESAGFPQDGIGFFGFGLAFENQLLLPVVTENETLSLCVYDTVQKKIDAFLRNSNGIYFPIGEYEGKSFYIAKDPLSNPDFSQIVYYNGRKITKIK